MRIKISTYQYEVNLFGPGYGESVAARIGPAEWVIIDSCLDSEGKPAPLAYLESIGVPPEHVKLLIASHWHDDHVRGFSSLVERCTEAKVCMSRALTKKEFQVFAGNYNKSHPSDKLTSGTNELNKVLQTLNSRKATGIVAWPDRRLWQNVPSTENPETVEVWSLSPSDECTDRFINFISASMPQPGATKSRAPSIKENETAIAILITYGDTSVLLGADLEETHRGWTAIVESTGRPQTKSNLFKIPHHGSLNGHHDGVWETMLVKDTTAIMTPYNKGHKLPKDSDILRIKNLTPNAYTTRILAKAPKPQRSSSTEKMIKATAKKIVPIEKKMGHIHAKLCTGLKAWEITLNQGAESLHGPTTATSPNAISTKSA